MARIYIRGRAPYVKEVNIFRHTRQLSTLDLAMARHRRDIYTAIVGKADHTLLQMKTIPSAKLVRIFQNQQRVSDICSGTHVLDPR